MIKYYFIGDIAILKKEDSKLIEELKNKARSIITISSISTEKRIPTVKILWGSNDLKTIHKELGVKYVLDLSKVMFSKGNIKEKKRLMEIVDKNDIVVDMFCGIGYFSLPISKKVEKIYSIDINPYSIKFLIEAIKLNKFNNIVPILSDNRKIKLKNIANRVIMGYIFNTEYFLDTAIKFINNSGIIHFHRLFNRRFTKKEIEEFVLSMLNTKEKEIIDINKVKEYSPSKIHWVVDIRIKK